LTLINTLFFTWVASLFVQHAHGTESPSDTPRYTHGAKSPAGNKAPHGEEIATVAAAPGEASLA